MRQHGPISVGPCCLALDPNAPGTRIFVIDDTSFDTR